VVLSDLTWPGGARFAVSLTFDVDAEAGWLGEGGEQYARRLTTLSEGRFGVVRGLPRIAEALARHGLAATFFVPGYTAELHSEAIVALVDAGHEIGHHGYLHLRSDKVDADAQRAEIERGFAALEAAGLPRPVGYRSAAWELTPETFDLLIEQDFAYDSSCMCDDRPYWEEWHGRRILELPVHWSLDDWPRFGWTIDRGGNMSDPRELTYSWQAEIDLARAEGRHLVLTMHPEVIGRGSRFMAFSALLDDLVLAGDAWLAPLAEVAAHVRPGL
jgi:peptidoglycan/xylan/chitin deacetylase (PgdA/CDA1 family)